ncbi:hypothetical protein L211DRAFT_682405 [Terfezia boudieri ATCC MYA-4762]|uniref:Uncharacterized protein n=1 Tax=Terfezia boudieri ATCC MYA-4762 TaxID=1051890 RepID=A0A3N4LXV9_9PEZI|nr:hypothetical protein L211DRAFT_682405 [Terfezia boudieri ATCC MYA-4762]
MVRYTGSLLFGYIIDIFPQFHVFISCNRKVHLLCEDHDVLVEGSLFLLVYWRSTTSTQWL